MGPVKYFLYEHTHFQFIDSVSALSPHAAHTAVQLVHVVLPRPPKLSAWTFAQSSKTSL